MASKEREEHIITAPFLHFDIEKQLSELRSQEQWKFENRNAITLVKNARICVILIVLRNGAQMQSHRIAGSLTIHVVEGSIRFILSDESYELNAPSMISLDNDITHDVLAVTDSAFILTIMY